MDQLDIILTKDAKTFTEQLHILQNRGIVIENSQEAVAVLQRINYYRLGKIQLKKINIL